MVLPGFLGPTYTERSLSIDAQRCINLFPVLDPTGKESVALVGTPGLRLAGSLVSQQPVRGLHTDYQYIYAVIGNTFYHMTASYQIINSWALFTTQGRVYMEHNNNNQLCIVDGINLYTYNTSTLALFQNPANVLTNPTSVCFIDQFFVISGTSGANTQAMQSSAVNDGTTWSALAINFAAADPDPLLGVKNVHRLLYAFGAITTEIWYDAGLINFPFQFSSNVIDYGTHSFATVATVSDTVTWLARDATGGRQVVMAQGYGVQIISTPALEQEWAKYNTVADAFAFAYQYEGSSFYVITFPSAGTTYAYDTRTQLWHQRASLGVGYWRPNSYCLFNDLHIVGDSQDGDLYIIDANTFTDSGTAIERIRSCPHIWNDRKELFFKRLQVDFESGVGLSVPVNNQGVTPQAQLRWSNDGGKTWGNYHSAPIGPQGAYKTRSIWRTLGHSRDRVFEVSTSEPCKIAMVGASVELTQGVI